VKKLFNPKIFGTLLLFTLLFSIFINSVPVRAATIIIAASDSSSTWKSQAIVTCTGTNDQTTINNYLTAGNTVQLAPGTFSCNNWILPKTGSRLYGQGNTTIIKLNNTAIFVTGASNVELDHFKLTGTAWISGAVFIGNGDTFYIHDITAATLGGDDFVLYANNGTISNASFVRCDANNPDGDGFLVNGVGSPSLIQDITFYKCTVENAGVASTRTSPWITGFNFAEYGGSTVNRLQAIACTVNGSWESDFHSEIAPIKKNFVITDCTAISAGLQSGKSFYGTGYLIPFVSGKDDIILSNNSASNNQPSIISWGAIPDLAVWNASAGEYTFYSPPQNMIDPSNSTKISSRINQGNCTGLMVTDGNYKNLYIFSSDGNPVNQQIALGGYFAANDGKLYSFNGQNIVVQFNDYAVIRLVASNSSQSSNPPTTTTTTSSNSSGSQTLVLNPIGNKTVVAGTMLNFTLSATDSAGKSLQYSADNLPIGASLQSDHIFRWQPTAGQVGTYPNIHFQVSDGTLTASENITIVVTNSSGSQTLVLNPIGNKTVVAGTMLNFMLSATDSAGKSLQYSADNLPIGASLQSDHIFRWQPTTGQVGTYTNVHFQVSDGTLTASENITIVVTK